MGVARSPGQVSRARPLQDSVWCQGGPRGREAVSSPHISGRGALKSLSFQDQAPQVEAWQGEAGRGRAKPGHSSGPGRSPDCSVWRQVSQLLVEGGRVVGARRREGPEEGSKQETKDRASSLRSENTSRLRSPVGGCVCGNETGRGRGRGKSRHALLGCCPRTSPFPTLQPTPLRGGGAGRVGGRGFVRRPPLSARSWFSCR